LSTATSHDLQPVYDFVDAHAAEFIEELCELIKTPSRTGHLDELKAAAPKVVGLAEAAAWSGEVVEVDDLAPVLFLQRPGLPGSKTLLTRLRVSANSRSDRTSEV
jgi:acetylornithine deacetylase/succinyl-diaminopimelate desuccinylase-like protein